MLSSKGQIVLPVERRKRDRIEPGQQLEIERVGAGEYLPRETAKRDGSGLLDWLRDCPSRGWFRAIPSESTDEIDPAHSRGESKEANRALMFLVDTNVLGEATKPRPDAAVLEWLGRHETRIAVHPVILGELEYGILLLPSGKKRDRLRRWFAGGVEHLPVLDLDASTGRTWALLLAELKRKGRAMPVKDSLVAATARQHRLTVATRNTKDFAHAGVKVIDPFGG